MKNNHHTSISQFRLRDLPGSIAAFIGFGMYLLSLEANHLPAVQAVTTSTTRSEYTFLLSVVVLCVLTVSAVGARKHLDHLVIPNAFVLAAGVLCSISLCGEWNQIIVSEGFPVSQLSTQLNRVTSVLLFFCWVKEFFPHGPFITATIFSFSCIAAALCSGFTALMRAEAAVGILVLLPVASSICLCYFRKALQEEPGDVNFRQTGNTFAESYRLWTAQLSRRQHLLFLTALAVSMFCYAFIFGYIHLQWLVFQDNGTMSFIMQLGIALGSAFAGIFTLLFVRCLWSYLNLKFYLFSLAPITILALWLTSIVNESAIFFYLILLNFAQKSVFFFMTVLPFFIESRHTAYWPWITICLAFEAGKVISSLAIRCVDDALYGGLSTVAVVLLFICCGLIISLDIREQDPSGEANERESETLSPPLPAQKGRFKSACWSLAEEYQLTNREFDALILLARGRTANYIAESMVISPSTAKVYVRNVYAKIGVHTQQDLISLVEERIDENQHDKS